MDVVIDTNILVATLLGQNESASRKVIEWALNEKIQPLVGEALFNEYLDVLNRPEIVEKCPLGYEERLEFLSAFLARCRWQKIYYAWRPNLKDEGDNHVIELAVAGGATHIITQNIRDLGSGELFFKELTIMTPRDFAKEQSWA